MCIKCNQIIKKKFEISLNQFKNIFYVYHIFKCSATGGVIGTTPKPYGFEEIIEFFSQIQKKNYNKSVQIAFLAGC